MKNKYIDLPVYEWRDNTQLIISFNTNHIVRLQRVNNYIREAFIKTCPGLVKLDCFNSEMTYLSTTMDTLWETKEGKVVTMGSLICKPYEAVLTELRSIEKE